MNCVFMAIALCSSVISAMEITADQPNKKFPSLKKLCVQHIVKSVTTAHEELEKCVQGATRYHMMPEELQQAIMKKLPDRPRCTGVIPCEFYPHFFNQNNTSPCCIGTRYIRKPDGVIDRKTILMDVNSGLPLYEFQKNSIAFAYFDADGRFFYQSASGDAHFGCFQATNNKENMCKIDWVEIWAGYHGRRLYPFTSCGNELMIFDETWNARLLDFMTGRSLYGNVRYIQDCAEKHWLLVLDKNDVLRIIERDTREECHAFDNTFYFLISPNGTFLFREDRAHQQELINLDTNSKCIINDVVGNTILRYYCHVFSGNSRYLIFFDYIFHTLKIIDLQSYDFALCKRVGDCLDYTIAFSEQSNYLVWTRRSHEEKLQDGVLNQLIVKIEDIFNDEKTEFSIEAICGLKSTITGSYSKLKYISSDEKYVCQFHNGQAEFIDLETSCVVMRLDDIGLYARPDLSSFYKPFNPTGKVVVLPPCISDKNKVCVVHLENDLTVDQFLLKRLICERGMTREKINENVWLRAIYEGLTLDQKKYFDEYVFAQQ